MCPPSRASLPTPTPSHPSRFEHWFELPESCSLFPLAIYFMYVNIYVSMLLSKFVAPSPSQTVSTCLFSMSASSLLPCK